MNPSHRRGQDQSAVAAAAAAAAGISADTLPESAAVASQEQNRIEDPIPVSTAPSRAAQSAAEDRQTRAVQVRTQRGQSNTQDMQSTHTSSGRIPLTGSIADMDRSELDDLQVVQNTEHVNKLAQDMKFMDDMLDVIVHDTNVPGEEAVVQVGVNGINQFFPRGETVTCRRMFVECLARAKPSSIQTSENPSDTSNRVTHHRALKYPFSVEYDPAGRRGVEWLREILKQP